MRNLNQDTITQAVIACLANTQDARLKEVLTSLVQHLHAFAREVKLTDREWEQGIEFLTRVGHMTDDRRQEFILLSDTLGLSTLVVAMNHDKPEGCTEATVFGPFHVQGAPHYLLGQDIANGAEYVKAAESLQDLTTRWKNLPAAVGDSAEVIAAAKATKERLNKTATLAAELADQIPY